MMTNYVSIKSVLYQLALTVDERYWNEAAALEWATHAYRQIPIEISYETKIALLEVYNHKTELPADFKYLNQVAYTNENVCVTCTDATDLWLGGASLADKIEKASVKFNWKPMRLTTNTFAKSSCTNKNLFTCASCAHEFSIAPNLILTTTLKTGSILISYLAYPVDEEGDSLIPDNEDLKEAILHYVLYKYWMSKYQMKEEGAESRMDFHYKMWGQHSKKALNLNLPDLSTMENIKNMHNRLVPRSNQFENLFMTLGGRENVDF